VNVVISRGWKDGVKVKKELFFNPYYGKSKRENHKFYDDILLENSKTLDFFLNTI